MVNNHWLVVSNMTGLFSISYMGCHHGCHPSHLTNSYFSRLLLHHHPDHVSLGNNRKTWATMANIMPYLPVVLGSFTHVFGVLGGFE